MKKLEALTKKLFDEGALRAIDPTEAKYFRLEAEVWLAEVKGK